jgi:hypothetical protein
MTNDVYPRLLEFLERLERAKIHYRLSHPRSEAVMVEIAVPGERWEVEFLDDGSVDVERFRSNGRIYDESMIDELFARYSAESPEPTPEQVREYHDAFFRS